MPKQLVLSALLMAMLNHACKKQKNNEPENCENTNTPANTFTYANYAQLKTGNYWVYQQFEVDTTGASTALNVYDSCYVQKDTLINNKTYMKLMKPKVYNKNVYEALFLRDSLHYLVSSLGKIVFSSEDFSTLFSSEYFVVEPSDTICYITTQMADKNKVVSCPAGTYTTMEVREKYAMYPNWSSAGNPRYKYARYAKDVGIIIETLPFFASIPKYTERRLVRYHLN